MKKKLYAVIFCLAANPTNADNINMASNVTFMCNHFVEVLLDVGRMPHDTGVQTLALLQNYSAAHGIVLSTEKIDSDVYQGFFNAYQLGAGEEILDMFATSCLSHITAYIDSPHQH